MKKRLLIPLFYFLSIGLQAENTVCLDITDNPKPNEAAFRAFTKYIDVFGIGIYAEPTVSDEKVKHVAAIFAEWLDNDEDGEVDDSLVLKTLIDRSALMPVFAAEGSDGEAAFFNHYEGDGVGAVCYEFEIRPNRPLTNAFDATVEENLHTISSIGYANAYPATFAEGRASSSLLTQAMDIARGGRFINIPNFYPDVSWYHYDDETCEYECMVTEYFYWGLTSLLGMQDYGNRCANISNEWEACTTNQFQMIDLALYKLLIDPKYKLPINAPDGNYCPSKTAVETFVRPVVRWQAFPNPTTESLTFQGLGEKAQTITFFDDKGQRIQSFERNQSHPSIDLKYWEPGLYFIQINRQTQKVIIQSKNE